MQIKNIYRQLGQSFNEYTPAGRKSKLIYPDGYYVNYGYDSVGRLNAITDSRGKVLWSCSYDEAGRRLQTTGLYGLTTYYDYEDASQGDNRGLYLDGITHTLGEETISFEYERDLAGNITTKHSKNSKEESFNYLYDKNYSLTSVVFEDETELVFNYDNLFNRVAVEYEQDATNYTLFENGLNQYVAVDGEILEYDLNGNLVQHGTRYYLYDSENQMLATYNLAGEPNETQVSLYSYDEFGRRISKAVATGIGESTTPPAVVESYLYDGFQAIGEYDASGEYIRRRFIYAAGIDEPIAMVAEPAHQGFFGFDEFSTIATSWLYDSNDIGFNEFADFNSDGIVDLDDLKIFASDFYLDERPLLEIPQYYGYAFDGLGSVVAITFCNDPNQTGDPNELPFFIETYEYDAFGTPTIYDADEQIVNQSQIGNPYLFTGRRYDSESGLYYYRFRMYDAELGCFLQTDPIGYYDSMNLYQYCGNNPINFVDPFGEIAATTVIVTVIVGKGIADLIDYAIDLYETIEAQDNIRARLRREQLDLQNIQAPIDSYKVCEIRGNYIGSNMSDAAQTVEFLTKTPGTTLKPYLPRTGTIRTTPRQKVPEMPDRHGGWGRGEPDRE